MEEIEEIEIKDEPLWEPVSYPVFQELSVCLENINILRPQAGSQAINGTNCTPENLELFNTINLRNFTVDTNQDQPITDLRALYKESKLRYEKQYFYQNILHHIMETSILNGVKELEKQYMEQLRKVSNLKVLKCSQCNYETIQILNIKLHLQLVHDSDMECNIFQCKECEYTNTNFDKMMEHANVHKTLDNSGRTQYDEVLQDNFSDQDNSESITIEFEGGDDYYDNQGCGEDVIAIENDLPTTTVDKNLRKTLLKCSKCHYQCFSKHFLNKHRISEHKNKREGKKDIKLFKNGKKETTRDKKQLQNEKVRETNQPNQTKKVVKHVKSHPSVEEVFKYCCDMCSYRSNSKIRFDIHLKIHQHNPEKLKNIRILWRCPEPGCEFEVNPMKKMIKHVVECHTVKEVRQPKKYVCEDCRKVFRNATNIRKHKLAKHVKVEKEEDMFHCYNCNYKTGYKRYLFGHMKIHAPKCYVCDVCGRSIFRKKNYEMHMQTHMKDKLPKSYECNICDYKTFNKYYLTHHMNVGFHRGNKDSPMKGLFTFECGKCGSRHLEGSSMKKHYSKKHSEIKCTITDLTRRCLKCDFGTKDNIEIIRHNKENHKLEELLMLKKQRQRLRKPKEKKEITQNKKSMEETTPKFNIEKESEKITKNERFIEKTEPDVSCSFKTLDKYFYECHLTEIHKNNFLDVINKT